MPKFTLCDVDARIFKFQEYLCTVSLIGYGVISKINANLCDGK